MFFWLHFVVWASFLCASVSLRVRDASHSFLQVYSDPIVSADWHLVTLAWQRL